MKNKKLIITIITILFLFISLGNIPVNGKIGTTQSSPLASYLFSDLGYNTSVTYLRGGVLTLQFNCTGSTFGIYYVRVFLHITGEDSYYFLRINGGIQGYSGGPGDSYFTGWQERSIDPGFFTEGLNTLQIITDNYPLSDDSTTIKKYLIILPDSYVEIYDATALPLMIEWQGYEFNETSLTLNILIIEKLTKLPVNNVNALDRVQETIDAIRDKEEKYKKKNPAEIVLLFIDTMWVHPEVDKGINGALRGISKRNNAVNYWGKIAHSKKVSFAQISKRPLYEVLKNLKTGWESKKFSKCVIDKCFDYYGYK